MNLFTSNIQRSEQEASHEDPATKHTPNKRIQRYNAPLEHLKI